MRNLPEIAKDFAVSAAIAVVFYLSILSVPIVVTGCVGPQTREAVVFHTFRSTYNATRTAYEGYLELVVNQKVDQSQVAKVDAAWNDFRSAFALAFKAASNDWTASTPESAQKIADDFIKLVRTL